MPNQTELQAQFERMQQSGFDVKLARSAEAHGFAPAFFFAIASRETNCINQLGDFQNFEAHGVGIVQIDIQHDVARQSRDDGSWHTNPDLLIDFGAKLLADNIRRAEQTFPNMSREEQLKIAASGYNCGMGGAIAGARHGDSDVHTTGHNYGADVMARMAIFEELAAKSKATNAA